MLNVSFGTAFTNFLFTIGEKSHPSVKHTIESLNMVCLSWQQNKIYGNVCPSN